MELPNELLSETQYNNINKKILILNDNINNNNNHSHQKEFNILNKILQYNNDYKKLIQEKEENIQLLNQSTDNEINELIKNDIQNIELRQQDIIDDFNYLIYDDSDENIDGISIEIRGATGGREAALFADDLFNMYQKFALNKKWKCTIEDIQKTNEGGIKEAVVHIKNKDAYSLLKYESGVHRVQRVPETESKGRIHTSTATIAVLPILNKISDVVLDAKDIQIDVYRASGAGGQHVNTTESAVRLTHIPTGTVVIQQDERSQHKNKEKAMGILKTRVMQKMIQSQMEELCNQRLEQIGKGQRCEKIRTYNFPQDRVTDHRINYSVFNIEAFINGEKLEELSKTFDTLSQKSILEQYN